MMSRLVRRKLLHLIPVVLLVTFAATALSDLLPGSPGAAILGQGATPEEIAVFDARHGYDLPLLQRYVSWLGGLVTGDLGVSVRNGLPVTEILLQRLPVTLQVAVLALALSLAIAIPLALVAAMKPGRTLDRLISGASAVFISVPSFLAALLLLFLLSYTLGWFPTSGWYPDGAGIGQRLSHVFLPAASLAVVEAPIFLRILRSDVISTLQEDYILAARSKGLSSRYTLLRHALRPSMFSLATVAGLSFGRLIGGSIVVEFLFALPGVGNLVIQSIHNQDIPVVQGIVVFTALAYIAVNTLVDLTYAAIDPRVRAA